MNHLLDLSTGKTALRVTTLATPMLRMTVSTLETDTVRDTTKLQRSFIHILICLDDRGRAL